MYNNYPRQVKLSANLNNEPEKLVNVPAFFIESDLYLNLGHHWNFHFSFPDSEKEKDASFEGVVTAAGKDHIIVHRAENNTWYLLPLLYLNYAETKEKPKQLPVYNSV